MLVGLIFRACGLFPCDDCYFVGVVICWPKFLLYQVVDSLRHGHQAMVFVHSRKDTGKTADKLVYTNASIIWHHWGTIICNSRTEYAFIHTLRKILRGLVKHL